MHQGNGLHTSLWGFVCFLLCFVLLFLFFIIIIIIFIIVYFKKERTEHNLKDTLQYSQNKNLSLLSDFAYVVIPIYQYVCFFVLFCFNK